MSKTIRRIESLGEKIILNDSSAWSVTSIIDRGKARQWKPAQEVQVTLSRMRNLSLNEEVRVSRA
jgi:hypothetical protein